MAFSLLFRLNAKAVFKLQLAFKILSRMLFINPDLLKPRMIHFSIVWFPAWNSISSKKAQSNEKVESLKSILQFSSDSLIRIMRLIDLSGYISGIRNHQQTFHNFRQFRRQANINILNGIR